MRLYVESNFLVELALEQEQSVDCGRLLVLAERGMLELVVPAYAIMESHDAVFRRLSSFDDLESRVNNMLSQVGRNAALTTEANKLKGLTTRVRQSAVAAHDRAAE